MCLWLAAGANTVWLLTNLCSNIWYCNPRRKAWDFLVPGRCLDAPKWYQGTAACSVAIDAFILLLPVPILWGLQAKLGKKLWVMFVFLCGYW